MDEATFRRSPASYGAAVVVAATIAFTYSSLFAADRYPLFRDVVLFFIPLKEYLAAAIREGRVALWNPHILLGSPFLAELQTGVFYPPSLMLLVPEPLGLNLFLVFHYFVAAAGIGLLLRRRGIGEAGIVVGTLTFVIGGFLVSLMNVMNFLQSAAWAPWMLLVWSRFLERSTRGGFLAFVGVVCLQTLGGGVEVEILTFVLLGLVTLSETLPGRARAGRGLLLLALALVLGGAAVAVQLLPTAELVRHSSRSGGFTFDEVTGWSLQPVSLMQLVVPQSSSLVAPAEQGGMNVRFERGGVWLGTIYFGLVPIFFATAGAAVGRERALWLGLAVAGFVLALGSHTPVFGWLYAAAPGLVGKFRYPEKCFFLAHVAVTILAAEGAHRLFAGERAAGRLFAAAALTIGLVVVLVALARHLFPLDFVASMRVLGGNLEMPPGKAFALASDLYFKSVRAALIAATAIAGLALQRRGWIRRELLVFLLVGLAAADLASAHRDFNLSIPSARLEPGREPIDVAALRASRLRVFPYAVLDGTTSEPRLADGVKTTFPSGVEMAEWMGRASDRLMVNATMLRRVDSVGGGAGIVHEGSLFFQDGLKLLPIERSVDLAAAYSVRYLLGIHDLSAPRLRRVASPASADEIRAYEVASPAPRAYLAGRLHAATAPIDVFNRMIDPDFRAGRDAVVEVVPEGWVDAGAEESIGAARIASYEAERVRLEVRATRPALLVLNDTFYPGWVARVDGSPVEIVRANHIVRGVFVDPGEHDVEFSYEPASFRIGLAISAAAWLILAGIAISAWRSRARSP